MEKIFILKKYSIINYLKNKKKYIMMLIFPIEFILSLLFAYLILRYKIEIKYLNHKSVKFIIGIIILGVEILLLIIYNYKNSKEKIERVVISTLIPIGMIYLVFMLPSQAPDETAHLFRSYEVSKGVFFGRKDCISVVPEELYKGLMPYTKTYKQFCDNIIKDTDYNNVIEVENPAASYPFTLYIFSSVGFIIARIFNLNILIGCYLAKLMNFAVFLVIAYYVLKIIPFGKLLLATIMFMPMFLQQATSVSADCLINALSILFISFILYLYFKDNKIKKREGVFLVIIGILLTISKYVYFPLIGMSFILIFSKNLDKKYKIILLFSLFIFTIVATVGYYIFAKNYIDPRVTYFEENNVNVYMQIKWIISNPMNFLYTLIYTLKVYGLMYIFTMIGDYLGWLNIPVPKIIILAYLFIMIISCFIENNRVSFTIKQKIWNILIVIAIIILIITGMFITWTGVGSTLVQGVQGRYFIPILPLVLLCLCKNKYYIKIKNVEHILIIILYLLNLPALNAIYNYFI